MQRDWYFGGHFCALVFRRLWSWLWIGSFLLSGVGSAALPQAARAQEAVEPPLAAPRMASQLFLPAAWNNYTTPVPSSLELIFAALEDGQIDYPTSLLYRAYALYMDPALPVALRGGMEEDLGLYTEIEAAWASLPAEIQSSLNGFRVRPNSPESALKGPWTLPTGVTAQAEPMAPAVPQAEPVLECDPGTMWGSIASATLPVRVHAQCFGGPLDNNLTLPHLQQTLQALESLWQPMVDFMGVTPLEDTWASDDGGDERIDFYLLLDNEAFKRNGADVRFRDEGVGGFARPLLPRKGKAASGYVVLRRTPLLERTQSQVAFRKLVAHELFHLFEFARNEQMLNRNGEEYWLTEASAVWAAWYFVPEERNRDHGRFTRFQNSSLSLHASGPVGSDAHKHTYSAYIWPFFMQQQATGFVISLMWKDFANVDTWDEANAVVNKWVNFDTNFPLFALRNLNDVNRFGPAYAGHYVQSDPFFPDGTVPPSLLANKPLLPGEVQSELVNLPALKAQYFHYTVDPDVQKLQVDVSDIAPKTHFKANLVAKIRGKGWKVMAVPGGGVMTFCPDNNDEDIEEFYLVLSNSDIPKTNQVSGLFFIRDLAVSCACQDFSKIDAFTGTITFDYVKTAENADHAFSINQGGQITFTLQKSSEGSSGVAYIGFLTGTVGVNDSHTWKGPSPTTDWVTGTGAPVNGNTPMDFSRAALAIRLTTCAYNFSTAPYVRSSENPSAILGVGSVRSGDRPLPFPVSVLSGEADFVSHTDEWGLQNSGDAYFPGGYGMALFDYGLFAEGMAGAAHVKWTLTPVFTP